MKRTLAFAAAGAIVVALAVALAACGGDGDSDGVASLTGTGQTSTTGSAGSGGAATPQERRQAELDFARCMREHGVDMPDPTNGQFRLRVGRGDDQQKVEEAQRACRPILRNVAPRMTEEQQAKMRDAALAFAKCMREHGVDMPDPQFPAGGGMTMRMPRGSSPDDPKVQEAQKACTPILQSARPDKAGTGGSESS